MSNSQRAVRRLLRPKQNRGPKILSITRPRSRRAKLRRALTSR